MIHRNRYVFAILAVLLLCAAPAHAAADQNLAGALLVYPAVLTEDPVGATPVETWLRVTNYDLDGNGGSAVDVHLWFVDGDTCAVCDTIFPLAVKQTAQVVVKPHVSGSELLLPTGGSLVCSATRGYVMMSLEASGTGTTIGDNLVAGEQIFVDPVNGRSFATRAFPFQGLGVNNGDRDFSFDGVEYSKLPRIIAFDFVAPNVADNFNTYVALLTPGFAPPVGPPATDCSITGYDDQASPFSSSHPFPCWSLVELTSVDAEFGYPNLGLSGPPPDDYGWLQANCTVDPDDGGTAPAGNGGVLGLIFSLAPINTVPFARSLFSPLDFESPASWGRLGLQSVTTGDAVTFDNP